MSKPPAGQSDVESNERVASGSEQVQTESEKAIIEAKQEVSQIRTKAKLSNISKSDAVSAFRAKLEEYITTAQGTLYAAGGPELWEQRNFGATRLAPPGHAPDGRSAWQLPDGTELSYQPEPVAVPHVGLESLFRLNDPLRRSVKFTVNRGRFGSVETTATARGQVDWRVLDVMFIHLNQHINSLGLDVQIEEDEGNAKWEPGDYRDE